MHWFFAVTAKTAVPNTRTLRSQKVHPKYSVVLDLNGLLVHRVWKEETEYRPGYVEFLNWLHEIVHSITIWSAAQTKKVDYMVKHLIWNTRLERGKIHVMSQEACTVSSAKRQSNPHKPYFLKDVQKVARQSGLGSTDYILLIDDSPEKNLLNSEFQAIHPSTWSGDVQDKFLNTVLKPWLEGLFSSAQVVPTYVEANPLPGGQSPIGKDSPLAQHILGGIAS